MRVFSVMGAYSLIANNEMVHLAMFIILLLWKDDMLHLEHEEELDLQTAKCIDLIDSEATELTWMHLIAFSAILIARINDVFE